MHIFEKNKIIMSVIQRCVSEAPGPFQQLAPTLNGPRQLFILSYYSYFNSCLNFFSLYYALPTPNPFLLNLWLLSAIAEITNSRLIRTVCKKDENLVL